MSAAFFCSGFDAATIVTMDGVGEYETTSWGVGNGTTIQKLGSAALPNSIGLFYSALTAFLGFEVNEGEYKVMGMAAFGEPTYYDILRPMFRLEEGGGFLIDTNYFEFLTPKEDVYKRQSESSVARSMGSVNQYAIRLSIAYLKPSSRRCV